MKKNDHVEFFLKNREILFTTFALAFRLTSECEFFYVIPEWGEYLEIVIAALHSSPHNTKVNEAEKSWKHKPATARQKALPF